MKNTLIKIRWVLRQAKPSMFYLFIIILIAGVSSVVIVYRAVIIKKIIDTATAHTDYNKFIFFILVFVGLIIFEVIINGITTALSVRCSVNICNNIQRKLFTNLTNAKWTEFSKYHSGDILTRMTSDIDAITKMIVTLIPSIIQLTVMIVASFITLLAYNSILAIVTLFMSPLPILLARLFGKKLKHIYVKLQETESIYRSFLNESIQNIIIIKSFCFENNNIKKISSIQKEKLYLTLKRNKIGIISNASFSLASWLGMSIALIFGSLKIFNGTSTYGTLTATIQLVGSIQGPFSALSATFPMIISAIGSSERIIELENLNFDTQISIDRNVNYAGLTFENISFSYNKKLQVLKNCSATIYPGETVALVGPSGQGKTTLVRLLLSLIEPDKGKIFVTYKNQKCEISALSRQLISYVPQGNTLFSGTIADNIRYGYFEASDDEIEAACKVACAWEFIKDLSEKIYTVIGEHGLGLSEGQAQRIAIARALIHKAPILIFDEATSALDNETEIKILRSIKNLNSNHTCIIITHRPTALKICQRIFKLDDTCLKEITKDFNNSHTLKSIENLA